MLTDTMVALGILFGTVELFHLCLKWFIKTESPAQPCEELCDKCNPILKGDKANG